MPFRPIRRLACLALSLALVGSACRSAEERAEQERLAAREAISKGQRGEAIAALERLREAQPDDAASFHSYVQLLVQAGEASRAAWEVEQELRRAPERHELRITLANILLMVNDPHRAIAAVSKVPESAPQHAQALLISGRAEQQLGNFEAGNRWFDEVERRYPDYLAARLARLNSLIEENRSEEASALLQELKARVAGRPPEDSDWLQVRQAEFALYDYQVRSGHAEAAQPGIEALLAESPEDASAWTLLVRGLEFQQRPLEGLERLRAALAEDPDRLWLYPIGIDLLGRLGDSLQQRAMLRDYAERSGRADAQLMLAQRHALDGEEDAALAVFDRAVAQHPNDGLVHFARGETMLLFERVADAEASLARFRELAPGDPRADYLKGRIQLAKGELEAGRDTLTAVVPQFDTAVSQYWIGAASEALGDFGGAERRYRAALARDPRLADAHLALLRRSEARGDWETLRARGLNFRAEHPGRIEAWSAVVTASIQLGQLDEALEAARSLTRAAPGSGPALVLLARAQAAAGQLEEALGSLDAAGAKSEAKAGDIEAERAIVLGRLGRVEQGLAVADAARATDPENAKLEHARALLLFQVGRAAEGAQAVDRALELAPGELLPLRARAEYRASTGDFAGARADAQRYLAQRSDDPKGFFVLGAAEAASGNGDAAIAAYRRAAELDLGDFSSRNNLAEMLAARGDLDGALAAAQEAYRIASGNGYVLDTLGALYLRKGLAERAVSVLEDARKAAPELAEARLHLAQAYQKTGRVADARALLDELRAAPALSASLRSEVDSTLAGLQ